MRNERRILLLGIRSISLSLLFTEDRKWREKLIDSENPSLGRDWRGSNPQLPPWQGGALTNWTTIPGGLFFFFFLSFEPVSTCCNRDTNDILDYYIEIYISKCNKWSQLILRLRILMFYYSYFMSWDIDILDTHYESIKSSYFSIVPIRFEKWERKKK